MILIFIRYEANRPWRVLSHFFKILPFYYQLRNFTRNFRIKISQTGSNPVIETFSESQTPMELISLPSEENQPIGLAETNQELEVLTLDDPEGTSMSSAMSEATVVPENSDLTPINNKQAPKVELESFSADQIDSITDSTQNEEKLDINISNEADNKKFESLEYLEINENVGKDERDISEPKIENESNDKNIDISESSCPEIESKSENDQEPFEKVEAMELEKIIHFKEEETVSSETPLVAEVLSDFQFEVEKSRTPDETVSDSFAGILSHFQN